MDDELKKLRREVECIFVCLGELYPPGCGEVIELPPEIIKSNKNGLIKHYITINLCKLIVKIKRGIFMKKLLLVFMAGFISFSLAGCVSLQATAEQEKSLEKVQEFPGLKKDFIYNKALSFVAKSYNSANDVIQLKDPATGQIICKGIGMVPDQILGMGMPRGFHYTLIIDVKDGKLRTRFENIGTESIGETAGADMAYQWDRVAEYCNKLRIELHAAISAGKSDDNW